MRKKLHIKKGDNVMVISGNHKGKSGRVLEITKKRDRAIVEGVNLVKKHQKPSAENPQGGIHETEAAIHISNLMVIDKKNVPTRIGRKVNDKGQKVRYSKKSNIDL